MAKCICISCILTLFISYINGEKGGGGVDLGLWIFGKFKHSLSKKKEGVDSPTPSFHFGECSLACCVNELGL
jgi:hypothetical protein